MLLAEIYGVLPAPAIRHTAASLWLFNSLLIGIVIALQRLATRTVRSALDRAERELADRKQTEEQLKAITQRLQLALEAGEIGVWDWDLRTNQVVYDDRLFAIYGLSPTPDQSCVRIRIGRGRYIQRTCPSRKRPCAGLLPDARTPPATWLWWRTNAVVATSELHGPMEQCAMFSRPQRSLPIEQGTADASGRNEYRCDRSEAG